MINQHNTSSNYTQQSWIVAMKMNNQIKDASGTMIFYDYEEAKEYQTQMNDAHKQLATSMKRKPWLTWVIITR